MKIEIKEEERNDYSTVKEKENLPEWPEKEQVEQVIQISLPSSR